MTVLITGSAGGLGRRFMKLLHEGGLQIRGFDLAETVGDDRVSISGSVLDIQALRRAMSDVTAVVHSAALMSRYRRPPEELFEVNVQGTYNVFQAAVDVGVSRVVLISSECATGLCFQKDEFPPAYLPVDTNHPLRPREPYGFSKMMQEEIAGYFWRSRGLRTIILRPLYVAGDWPEHQLQQHRDLFHPDLWGWVHPDDVAAAVRSALLSNIELDTFFVSSKTTVATESTVDRIQKRFGTTIEIRDPELYRRLPNASVFDTTKLERLLGVGGRPIIS
jgi:UDP-glucose 4-epimerase